MHGHAPKPFSYYLSPVTVLQTLALNRGLAMQFIRRQVDARHRGSYLGVVWIILLPLLMMGLYTFVFGVIFSGSFKVTDATGTVMEYRGAGYALGVFLSLTLFQFFSECLNSAPTIIVGNANYVKKVVFPLEILPLASIGAAVWNFVVTLALVAIGMAISGVIPSLQALWFPVIITPLILLALGVSWFLAALGVFLRDVAQIMGVVSMVLMYCSAVFYSSSMIPPEYLRFLTWNPLLHILENSRRVLIWNLPPDHMSMALVFGVSIAAFLLGFAFFKKMEPAFADVI